MVTFFLDMVRWLYSPSNSSTHHSPAGFSYLGELSARWWEVTNHLPPFDDLTFFQYWYCEFEKSHQNVFSSPVIRLFNGQMQNCLRESPGTSAWRPQVTWRMAGNRTTSPSPSRVPLADIWMSSLSTDEPSRSDHTSCCACNRSPLPVCMHSIHLYKNTAVCNTVQ